MRRSDAVRDDIQFPPGLTEAERAQRFESMKRKAASAGRLIQRLAPGETLHTRGDTAPDGFRNLNVDYRFKADGTYEMYIVLDIFSKSEKTSNHVLVEMLP